MAASRTGLTVTPRRLARGLRPRRGPADGVGGPPGHGPRRVDRYPARPKGRTGQRGPPEAAPGGSRMAPTGPPTTLAVLTACRIVPARLVGEADRTERRRQWSASLTASFSAVLSRRRSGAPHRPPPT